MLCDADEWWLTAIGVSEPSHCASILQQRNVYLKFSESLRQRSSSVISSVNEWIEENEEFLLSGTSHGDCQ
jgi:hypothetical protein